MWHLRPRPPGSKSWPCPLLVMTPQTGISPSLGLGVPISKGREYTGGADGVNSGPCLAQCWLIWSRGLLSCTERSMAPKAAINCREAVVGGASLGQPRMPAEGPTLRGKLPSPRGHIRGGPHTHTGPSGSSATVPASPLSPHLYNQEGAQTSGTISPKPLVYGRHGVTCLWPRANWIRVRASVAGPGSVPPGHGLKYPKCLLTCPHTTFPTPKLSLRQRPARTPHAP